MSLPTSPSPTTLFRAARDLLLRHRTDYDAAVAEFRWPELPQFNWALDHFDDLAKGNPRTALWIVDESGCEVQRSFNELHIASNRAANGLREQGVHRGAGRRSECRDRKVDPCLHADPLGALPEDSRDRIL